MNFKKVEKCPGANTKVNINFFKNCAIGENLLNKMFSAYVSGLAM